MRKFAILVAVFLASAFPLHQSLAAFVGVSPSVASTTQGAIPATKSTNSLNTGLVGYWTMDNRDLRWTSDTAGTIIDRSGNGNTGTLVGLGKATSTTVGKVGQSMKFDGSKSYINLGKPAQLNFTLGQPITLSAWVYWTGGNSPSIVQDAEEVSPWHGRWFGINAANGKLSFTITENTSSNQFSLSTNSSVDKNKWTFVTATFNGVMTSSGVRLYINGVNKAGTAANQGTVNTGTLTDGLWRIATDGKSTPVDFFGGQIDDVRIYNRALSAAEVKALYNQSAGTKMAATPSVASTTQGAIPATKSTNSLNTGLVGYWTMDNRDLRWTSDSAGTIIDRSGNGNTGTLVGLGKATSTSGGRIGQAIKLGTINSYSSVGNSPSLSLDRNFTISAWVKPSTLSSNGAIASHGDGGWYFRVSSTGQLQFIESEVALILNSTATIVPNQWQHALITVGTGSTANITIYINGRPAGQTTTSRTFNDASRPVAIGVSDDSTGKYDQFAGLIDDVRIYNRALSAAEVKALYNQSAGTKMAATPSVASTTQGAIPATKSTNSLNTGLVGYWTMDNRDLRWTSDTAGTIIDRSGNGNTGTLNGMNKASSLVWGKVGQAIKLNSAALGYVDAGDINTFDGANALTISLWVNTNSAVGGFVTKGDYYDAASSFAFGFSSQAVKFSIGNSTYGFYTPAASFYRRWKHLVVVYGPNGVFKIYEDAIPKTLTSVYSYAAIPSNAYTVRIGRDQSNTTMVYSSAKFDDVRIYNRVLTAQEVSQLYNQGR